jgi:hypothetical protein
MRTLYSALTLFAATSLAAAPLAAQQVIDQNQPLALGVFAAM